MTIAQPERSGKRPLTRAQRHARTRSDLIEAAVRVFAARGLHAATVEEVAAEAGYTSGAVYSNFAGKEELFLACLEDRLGRYVSEFLQALSAAGDLDDRVRIGTRVVAETLAREPEWFLLFIEFWSYSVRDEGRRQALAQRLRIMRDAMTELIRAEARRQDIRLPLPARDLAVAINGLGFGIALERMIDPEVATLTVHRRALDLLLAGVQAQRATGPRRA